MLLRCVLGVKNKTMFLVNTKMKSVILRVCLKHVVADTWSALPMKKVKPIENGSLVDCYEEGAIRGVFKNITWDILLGFSEKGF